MKREGKPLKARLVRRTHVFKADEYICANCSYSLPAPFGVCPRCGAEMRGNRYDPVWVDEMEALDAIFDD